jgi:hypothetical protein
MRVWGAQRRPESTGGQKTIMHQEQLQHMADDELDYGDYGASDAEEASWLDHRQQEKQQEEDLRRGAETQTSEPEQTGGQSRADAFSQENQTPANYDQGGVDDDFDSWSPRPTLHDDFDEGEDEGDGQEDEDEGAF